ncbi:B12-binding domain-containing radical SAM protein [Geobacter sp. SVR]|uniref:B12-binding domain-containing radical SAM protein n=1 Tax=Geobacter sp. SVR TaxID=2495594 RepID=UPI00143F02A9|nr:radical SAM protein [Geobacter sp. SVR]BCS53140.1 B12-binding domain-containing radical SAM protein [Geobacter sp. SVR]GCF84525.1 B12-binding domain-containing radical SAM protein [Geobacter sp. SVR]
MRIILVAIHPYPSPQAVPLGTAFLRGFLAASPGPLPQIEQLDFYAGQDIVNCTRELLALEPDAIGFSMYVWNRTMCREIARELAIRQPGVRLFAGGPEATADPAGILAEAPFEFLILGEGERPFTAACNRLATGDAVAGIPGIALQGRDGTISTISASPLPDLDVIPSPWLNSIIDSSRLGGILWQLSRGCGFKCDFCYDARGAHGVRRFSLKRIEAELRHFAKEGVSQVFVLDSTFNQDRVRAKTILKMIARIAPGIHFHFEVRSEFIDREMSHLFAAISCSLQIGLQSADPQVMQGVGRRFDPRDFRAKASLLNESGAVFGFDLIYGLPGDSFTGFSASIDFALTLYPNHLDIFPLAILPGTALAERAGAIGLEHLPAPPYTLISSPSFSPGDMSRAHALAAACDIFYTRGKAVAWFNSVCAALKLRPSELLHRFADWLAAARGADISEDQLSDEQIWQIQRTFLSGAFGAGRWKRVLPLALDLVDYHYHYAAALLTPPPTGRHRPKHGALLGCTARLAPSTRLVSFHYEILDILAAGEPDLISFTGRHAPTGSWAVIYPHRDGILTESLAEPYYRLLDRLDGNTSCGRIAEELGIPADEAQSFVEFALTEGLISMPKRYDSPRRPPFR